MKRSNTPRHAVFDLKYKAATVRVDLPTAQKATRRVSQNGRVVIFAASDAHLAGLRSGDVVWLEPVGALRILAIQGSGEMRAARKSSMGKNKT